MADMKTLCRLCLSESEQGVQIFDINDDIVKKVETLASVKISEDDNFPKTCCLLCVENVNNAYKVRQGIIEADNYFHEKYQTDKSKNDLLQTKDKKLLEFSNSATEIVSQNTKVDAKVRDRISSIKKGVTSEKKPLSRISPISSALNTPFETVFIPTEGDNAPATIDLNKMSEEEEEKILKRISNPVLTSDQIMKLHKQKILQQQKIQQQKIQQMKLQQHCQRLLQQQKVHFAKMQQQQQKLLQAGLTQQQKLIEQQRLQQLQKQKILLQQKQKVLSTALRQSLNKATTIAPSSNERVGRLRSLVKPFVKKCDHCGETIHDRYAYKLHVKKHQSKTCELCHVTVRTDNFKKHMDNVHKDEPAVCEICGKVAKNKESLRGHMYYIHQNRGTFTCEYCEKEFQTKHGYTHHVKKAHLGIRNHQCDICGKKFYSSYDVKKHINMTHNGARPYVCPYCKKGFSSTNARKVHMRQHTLETPYGCEFCPEAFRQKVSLKTHMKSKHGKDLKEVEAARAKLERNSNIDADEKSTDKILETKENDVQDKRNRKSKTVQDDEENKSTVLEIKSE